MHRFTVNYRERRDGDTSRFNRGFFLNGIPRLLPRCALLGHRPVVEGYGPREPGLDAARWVECSRCGVRPEPQGNLNPAWWPVGARYRGPFGEGLPDHPSERARAVDEMKRRAAAGFYPPGRWPRWRSITGDLGAQVVIGGRRYGGIGGGIKVGNRGSEHTLAADIGFGRLGAVHVWTEWHGLGLVKLLNGRRLVSKVIDVRIHNGHLWWKLWADRDGGWQSKARGWAKWSNHSIRLNPLDAWWGPKQYAYDDTDHRAAVLVRMPDGDYPVELRLQQVRHGRTKRVQKPHGWMVDWHTPRGASGIPTKHIDHRGMTDATVDVSAEAVQAGTWPDEAAVAIATRILRDRTRYGWEPSGARITEPERTTSRC